jgi:hypothetical protein
MLNYHIKLENFIEDLKENSTSPSLGLMNYQIDLLSRTKFYIYAY